MCLWIILLTFGVRQTVDAKPPNIIFMVADDLGKHFLMTRFFYDIKAMSTIQVTFNFLV